MRRRTAHIFIIRGAARRHDRLSVLEIRRDLLICERMSGGERRLIEEFIESERAAFCANLYVRHLSGGADVGPVERHEERQSAALAALERFSLVGVLERLGEFAESFHQRFNRQLEIGRHRVGPVYAEDKNTLATPEVRHRIEELCAPDGAVYECACRLGQGG